MKRITVESKELKSIGYNPNALILEVEFKKGDVYRYFGVPESHYRHLMNSESKRKYFNSNIRERFATAELIN